VLGTCLGTYHFHYGIINYQLEEGILMHTDKQLLDSYQNDLILLAQIRNSIFEILNSDDWKYTFIDNIVNVAEFTHYMIDDRYFSQFHTASDLDYFIHKPWKYYNEINICKLFDLVCDMAFDTHIVDKHDRQKTWDIYFIFEKFVDKNVDVDDIIEYIDDEIADELIDQIDYYSDLIKD
tara:strand:+ start:505 stop:1041 length:537 start_codon:yes stop_codon:yes gene_type:complete